MLFRVLLGMLSASCASPAETQQGSATHQDGAPSSAGATRTALINQGDAVFFVGNSFFEWDGRALPKWVAALGRATKPPFAIETGSHIVPGNHPLQWFFDQPESRAAIASKKYKVFVIQGEELEPVTHKEEFRRAVRAYHKAITANGGKLVLFMTWDFSWNEGEASPTFLEKLSSAYDELGRELHVPVIPVGLIYDDVNRALPPGEPRYFLTGSDLHQTAKGSLVNAYATFQVLTNIDPNGATFEADDSDSSASLRHYLSDATWARIVARQQQDTH
jgi:hypothetical protein